LKTNRENIEDLISPMLHDFAINDKDMIETSIEIADAVFEALGITEDEQEAEAGTGYFMLHAVNDKARPYQGDLFSGLSEAYDESGEFNETVLTSAAKSPEYFAMTDEEFRQHKQRWQELQAGAKYTSAEFKAFAQSDLTNTGWHISLKTPICTYKGCGAKAGMGLEAIKTAFVNTYYPMYLQDYERSEELSDMQDYERSATIAEMDKE
jgi:hypothetical protein